ncbi:MAG: YdeI/OmpD-associated family protein [Ginsengibacter sp.]
METTGLKYYAKDRKAWRSWLLKNHAKEPGVWLIYYKKDSGKTRVSYNDAVEEALCFGWIDSIAKPIDEEKYMQKFTPRKIKSVWSALNKKRVEKLLEQKLMTLAGMAIIDTGKKNGSWERIDHVENFLVPPDLKKFFAKNKKVFKYFEVLSKSGQKQWLYRLHNAKLPETRAKRIAELVEESLQKKS